MKQPSRLSPFAFFQAALARLRYPQLFVLAASLFLADLLIPDAIPFLDEILLGILTLLVSQWPKRRGGEVARKPPVKNVTPDR